MNSPRWQAVESMSAIALSSLLSAAHTGPAFFRKVRQVKVALTVSIFQR